MKIKNLLVRSFILFLFFNLFFVTSLSVLLFADVKIIDTLCEFKVDHEDAISGYKMPAARPTCASQEVLPAVVALPSAAASKADPVETPVQGPTAEWCVMIYIQASNNLSKFAKNNLQAMAEVGSRHNFHIVVQWHQPYQQGIWRYRIENGKAELKFSDEKAVTSDCARNLIDFVGWSAKNYAAKRYALILWNHGVGILDPLWGNPMPIYSNGDFNPRVEIEGITQIQAMTEVQDKELMLPLEKPLGVVAEQAYEDETYEDVQKSILLEQRQLVLSLLSSENRGVLFDEYNHTYLNNQGMVYALRWIKEKILFKKLDVLGIDACLMAMAEVMLQVQEYADYFVASQEVELAQGWDYKAFLSRMVGSVIAPQDLAKNIVTTFEGLYKGKTQLYTQSAVVLTKITAIYQHIDQVAAACKACIKAHGQLFKGAIKRARGTCLQFSTPTYIDLHSFYTELSKQIELMISQNKNKFKEVATLEQLRILLIKGLDLIKSAVVANVASTTFARAQGISIYYPRHFIDASYLKTEFAQANQWIEFLALNLEH